MYSQIDHTEYTNTQHAINRQIELGQRLGEMDRIAAMKEELTSE
jgi:hypothetical protein